MTAASDTRAGRAPRPAAQHRPWFQLGFDDLELDLRDEHDALIARGAAVIVWGR